MKYKNPIIKGFNPDPSICRVGNDYYLVTSSFEYFPGIPIYHSTDLVNWTLIGNCINRPKQLDMSIVKPSGGIWAPTIRYNNGIFYVTATFSEKGNFIITSTNPKGNWSDPVWVEMDGIDPSIYFENDKMYYCANDCGKRYEKYGCEGISVAEVDSVTGKIIGETKRIWNGTGGGFLEAPHIYHIGDWYYLLCAEGGASFNHMCTIARSKKLFGDYESYNNNPILTNRHDTSKQILCTGHADLIDDINGNWWFVHLGTRPSANSLSHLGRETFLTPVVLKDGWFIVENNKKATLEIDAPILEEQKGIHCWTADFNNTAWENEWVFLKNPNDKNYKRDGKRLILTPSTTHLTDETSSPTFAAVRQPDFEKTIHAELEFITAETGDEAGLTTYLSPEFHYKICKKRDNDGDYIVVEKNAEDFSQTAYCKKTSDGKLIFEIHAFKDRYEFYYSVNSEPLQFACSASTRFLACEIAGKCFTGTVIGLYTQSQKNTSAKAEINVFRID